MCIISMFTKSQKIFIILAFFSIPLTMSQKEIVDDSEELGLTKKYEFVDRRPAKMKILANEDQCSARINILLFNLLNTNFITNESKMLFASSYYVNDLGDYNDCNSQQNMHFKVIAVNFYGIISLNWGFCLFKVCDKKYFMDALASLQLIVDKANVDLKVTDFIQVIDSRVDNDKLKTKYKKQLFTFFGISLICLLLCLAATISHKIASGFLIWFNLIENYSSESINFQQHVPGNIIIGNSQYGSKSKPASVTCKEEYSIIICEESNKYKVYLHCFEGVRALSCGWLFVGTTVLSILAGCLKNFGDLIYYGNSGIFVLVLSSLYANDSLFYLSGFLLSTQCITDLLIKKQSISRLRYCVFKIANRYLKILPILLFIVFGATFIVPYISDGPLTPYVSKVNAGCPEYGWRSFLLLTNYYYHAFPKEDSCGDQLWFLSNDFQFTIFFIILFTLTREKRYIRNAIYAILIFAALFYQIYVIVFNHLKFANYSSLLVLFNIPKYLEKYESKPFAHIIPFIIGLFHGEAFMVRSFIADKEENEPFSIFKKLKYLSLGLILTSYAVISNYQPLRDFLSDSTGFWLQIFMITVTKIVFVLGLAIIMDLVLRGEFKFINKILASQAMKHLNSCSFIINVTAVYVIELIYFSNGLCTYIEITSILTNIFGILITSIFVAYLIRLFYEKPLIRVFNSFSTWLLI